MVIVITGSGKLSDPVSYFNTIFAKSSYVIASNAMRTLGYKVSLDMAN